MTLIIATKFFDQPYVQLTMAIMVFGFISASLWRYSDLFKVTRSDGTDYNFSPEIKSVSILLLSIMALVITCQRLAPTFWKVWGWSTDFWLIVVLSIVILIALKNKKNILSIVVAIAILALCVATLPEAYAESKRIEDGMNGQTTSPAHLDEVGEIMAQQNRMEEYYGTFHCTAGSDTSYLFVPAYSILNVKMPVGTKLSITDGNGKHYIYDGYIVTKPDGTMPKENEKLRFGVGDMYYKICNPVPINVTYLVRKKNRAEIQEALNQQ